MINTEHLCMSCMKEIGEVKQCPHCGFHADSPQIAPYLPIRAVVGNRYLIGKLLDANGEGATYIGWDFTNRVPVSVREFIPDAITSRSYGSNEVAVMAGCEFAYRECFQTFLELWRKLARLRGLSALINVIDIVEDNGTAYAVSEHFEGASLRDFLLASKTGYIGWERARQLLMPVLSTLGTLHSSGIIHRGISPSTLIIGKDGKLRIAGFSIWQVRTAKGDLNAQLFHGYAAIEQYGFEGQQGPWTDIYAFAGVLYRTLIGTDPLDAPDRAVNDRLMVPGKFAEQLPAYVINALINGLQIQPDNRTRSVEQLRADLSASPVAAVAGETYAAQQPSAPPVVPAAKPAKTGVDKNALMLSLKVALVTLGAGLLIFLILAFTVFKDNFFPADNMDTLTTLTADSTEVGEKVKVPNFSALGTYPEISSNPVWTARFTFKAEHVFDNTRKIGEIISQSIAPDTEVDKGTEILFTVSKGKEMAILPNVVGQQYAEAEAALIALGFKCIRLDKTNDGTQTPNTVFTVSPAIGKSYEKGTEIYLQVWTELQTTDAPADD